MYRRPWFVALLLVTLGVLVVGLLLAWSELAKWDREAQKFDYAKLSEMESASIIYDRGKQVLGRIFIQNRDQVPLDQLSPQLQKAVVGAEDARFYSHDGVDYFGILRAAVRNYQAGKTRQGASTLTQQLARNTFTKELPSTDRSYDRKVLEVAVAREVERRIPKEKILELYLNRVFFGSGFYGAEAASRGYFGKRAKDLDLSEAATLAGLLKSPNNLSPWKNRKACLDARNRVLERMLELKLISQAEFDTTLAQDLVVKNRRPTHQESYAAQLVAQQVERLVGYDKAVSEGYRIFTTIDGDLQKKADAALKEQLATVERRADFKHQKFADYDQMIRGYRRRVANGEEDPNGMPPAPEYLQGAIVILENKSGAVLTLIGGRDISHSEYDRAISARRPAGTAFKPIVYAAAFEKGLFPGSLLQDAVIDNRQVMIGGTTGILGEWGPERVDNTYEGAITARASLVKSKNAATVRLGMSTGVENVTRMAEAAGIDSKLSPYPKTFLGSSEVTLLEMTLANTAFASGGNRPEKPYIIDRIEEQSGRVIFQAKSSQKRVMKATTAFEVHSCLADVLERGTAEKAYTEYGLKRMPLGGKTGTAYNFTDVWFLGYSSELTCGVWAGFDKPRTPIFRGAFSNEVVLPVWSKVMSESFARYQPKEITAPKGIIKCEICSSSGLLATAKCVDVTTNPETGEKISRRTTYFEIATDAQAPTEGCNVHGDAGPALTQTPGGNGPGAGNDPSKWPKAAGAVNLATVAPIELKAPTVIGVDPFNSQQSVANALAMKGLGGAGQVAPIGNDGQVPTVPQGPAIEVRKAEGVGPMEQQASKVDSAIKLEPPPALDF